MPDATPRLLDRGRRLFRLHRRAAIAVAVAVVVLCTLAAGALANRGRESAPPPTKPKVTETTKAATTTAAKPATTVAATTTAATTAPPATEATPPPTEPPPPPPPATTTYTFEAPGAGTMTVKLENNWLSVVGVQAFDGWVAQVHTESGSEYVKVMFKRENTVRWVKARLIYGSVVPETGEWTECSTAPPPATETYELGGVGTITVTWNGSAFTLDAVTPFEGWVVASQEAPGEYVRVYFAPSEVHEHTDGGHDDGTRWIKVKIHDCQIVHMTGP